MVRDSLKLMGHEVVDLCVNSTIIRSVSFMFSIASTPPDPYEGLKIASQLILADAGNIFRLKS